MIRPVMLLEVAVTLTLAAQAAAEPASSDPTQPTTLVPSTSDKRTDEARRLFRDASLLGTAGNFQQALQLYERSNDLVTSASTLFNIGVCYMKLSEPALAWYSTQMALSASDWSHGTVSPLSTERLSEARNQAQQLYDQLVEVRIDLSSSARISVDENSLVRASSGEVVAHPDQGQTESQWNGLLLLLVPRGKHTIRFVDVATGARQVNEFYVTEEEPVSVYFPSSVAGGSSPETPSTTSHAKPDPPEPSSSISSQPVVVAPLSSVNVAPTDLWTNIYPVAQWSSLGVTGLGLVLAVAGAAIYLSADQTLKQECSQVGDCPEELGSTVNRHHIAGVVTNVGIWTAAFGSLGALTIYALKPKEAKPVGFQLKRGELIFTGQF